MIRSAVLRLLLDLGGVEKRGDDGCRADSDRKSGLSQFRPSLLGRAVIVLVAHKALSMASPAALEAA